MIFFPFFSRKYDYIIGILEMADAKSADTSIKTNKLNEEEKRLETFNEDWPHAFILPHILAKVGFYYTGPSDQVKCYFCNINVNSWEMGDNEINEHSRWSPNCPLLNGQNTSNIPKEPISELNELILQHKEQRLDIRFKSYVETPFTTLSINENLSVKSLKNSSFPKFETVEARLKTFHNWPEITGQTPQELAEAGFFFTQKEDRVICFSCGGGLCEWNADDNPWEQHALHYGKCNHIKITKGGKIF